MNRSEIITQIEELLLSSHLCNNELVQSSTEESRLSEDLGMHSAAMLYMVIAIEESFGIRFSCVGMADFKTLGSIVDYIEKAKA